MTVGFEQDRPPLLGVGFEHDHIIPPKVARHNVEKYSKSPAVTEFKEFKGQVDTALLHLGGVRFFVTGPLRYSMTARDAVELRRLVRPRTAIPIHSEGWAHFQQSRAEIEREFAGAPEQVRSSIRWLPVATPVDLVPEPA